MRGLLFGLLVLLSASVARAQEPPPLALFADNIRYESADQMLVASGNVQVYYQNFVLTAESIRYGGRPAIIRATGPIRLESRTAPSCWQAWPS